MPTLNPDFVADVVRDLPGYFEQLGVTVRHPNNHHLVAPRLPTPEEVAYLLAQVGGVKRLTDALEGREKIMFAMEHNALESGYRPDVWFDIVHWLEIGREVLIMGGNRSSKTEFAAWYALRDMWGQDGRQVQNRIWGFLHSSEQSSIRLQQPRIYRYLPPECRHLVKGEDVYVVYNQVQGFRNQTIILPNASKGYFFNYKQDPKVLEGYEFDGVWADELIPRAFEEAVRFRLVTRRGVLIETFTPIEGYSLTVAGWMAGAKVVGSKPSPLLPGKNVKDCPPGHMPYELECLNRNRRIFFFFTDCTPYGDPDNEMPAKLETATRAEKMIRAYGYPEKQVGNAFPKFSQRVNVIRRNPAHPWNGVGLVPPHPWRATQGKPALYPSIPPEGTNYCVMDPGLTKNHFIKWYHIIPEPPWVIVYREWPPMSTHGEWAVAGEKPDGKPGPAPQFERGLGISAIKRIILEAEGWVWNEDSGWDGSDAELDPEAKLRYIDPRLGGTEVPSETESKSLILMFEEENFDADGRLIGPSMSFYPAPGSRVLQGLELLNNCFDYDQDHPLSPLNCPRWYVVDACQQSIYAYEEYTGLDGEKGALKDIIDPDRYLLNADLAYVGPEDFEVYNPNLENE